MIACKSAIRSGDCDVESTIFRRKKCIFRGCTCFSDNDCWFVADRVCRWCSFWLVDRVIKPRKAEWRRGEAFTSDEVDLIWYSLSDKCCCLAWVSESNRWWNSSTFRISRAKRGCLLHIKGLAVEGDVARRDQQICGWYGTPTSSQPNCRSHLFYLARVDGSVATSRRLTSQTQRARIYWVKDALSPC